MNQSGSKPNSTENHGAWQKQLALKGHGFSRANKALLETWALAPEGMTTVG